MRNLTKYGSMLALVALAACNPENSGKKDKFEAPSSSNPSLSLEAKGDQCGQTVSVNELGDEVNHKRPMSLTVAIAICGKLEGDKGWRALGMTVNTPYVFVKKAGVAGYDATEDNKYTLSVDGKDDVYAVKGAKSIRIGRLSQAKHAYPVNLANTVKAEIVIKDHPYQVGDSKQTPDADKRIFLTVED